MSQQFHFIAGLPRSGSTLFSALLRQNPDFHADISSPVMGLVDGVIAQTRSLDGVVQRADGIFADGHGPLAALGFGQTNRS